MLIYNTLAFKVNHLVHCTFQNEHPLQSNIAWQICMQISRISATRNYEKKLYARIWNLTPKNPPTKRQSNTNRKQGFDPGLKRALIPVLIRTGTNRSISPSSWGQGAAGPRGAIGPGSSDTFGPGSSLALGPQPLIPVGVWNRDQMWSFSLGFSHQPGLKRGPYIPPAREQSSALLPLEHRVGFPLKRKGWCNKVA